jgi:KEOPS complex subunit Cgi121
MTEVSGNIKVVGLVGRVDQVEDLINSAKEFLQYGTIQFFDADMILGSEHIISAWEHAQRAFERKDNISSSLEMELLIYVSGEIQIASALKTVGIKDGCERIAMVVSEGLGTDELISHLSLKRDDDVLKCTESKLKRFGIGEDEIVAVDSDKIKDLILERVAMVDVRK